jgi:hypothetical protein
MVKLLNVDRGSNISELLEVEIDNEVCWHSEKPGDDSTILLPGNLLNYIVLDLQIDISGINYESSKPG